MIKKIKELLKTDTELNIETRDDKKLEQYIVTKAKEHLKSQNGGIEDKIVLGWARHFYLESQESIDKELKEMPSTQVLAKPKPKAKVKKVKKVVEVPEKPTIFEFGAIDNVV